MSDSLWGDELDSFIELAKKDKNILSKIKQPKAETKLSLEQQLKSKRVDIETKLNLIKEQVYKVLGKQINNVQVIYNKDELLQYVRDSIKTGVVAIDTETDNTTDPLTCKLMGLCLYSPGLKQVYVPVNHTTLLGERLGNQLTEGDCAEALSLYKNSDVFVLMHNAKFDFQVIKCTCGVDILAHWDTMIAAYLLDENEEHGLKEQYTKHIDPSQEKYKIEKLFGGLDYAIFPPELFALYAATDAFITYELYQYQKPIMESSEYSKIYKLFKEVEMPCVEVTASMELAGVEVDLEYAKRLSEKYHKKLEEIDVEVSQELLKLKPQIDSWKLSSSARELIGKKTKLELLEDPINLASPQQLAILLYDVLKVPAVDKEKPRGTGEDVLKSLSQQQDIPLLKLILKRRECVKLTSTYIDNIPTLLSIWPDNRIRTHFNQIGTDTGRFSSGGSIRYRDNNGNKQTLSGINMQNIPSHAKDIRMIFKAKDGYVLCGNDWSQQEPRLLSFLSGDEGMKRAYQEGRDLYATIAMGVYHNDYWDNMEHHQDGSPNPEGKKRRGNCKQVLLGISYGLGVPALAQRMGLTTKEAQTVMDDFYKAFPKVKEWQDKTISDAITNGYVEDIWGRRRRLPNIQLPRFTIIDNNFNDIKRIFNPIIGCSGRTQVTESAKEVKFKKMLDEDLKKKGKEQRDSIQDTIHRAEKEHVVILDNNKTLVHARNQCVNARIQGSAATMTKKAMIAIYKDSELMSLGFQLLIGVHDELIGECPKEHATAVANRLCDIMINLVKDDVDVPFKSDADIATHWYYNDYVATVKSEYEDLNKMGLGTKEAFHQICLMHSECTNAELYNMLYNNSED